MASQRRISTYTSAVLDPSRSSSMTVSQWPLIAAKCKAVRDWSSWSLSIERSRRTNSLTTSTRPRSEAKWSGVCSRSFLASASAPWFNKSWGYSVSAFIFVFKNYVTVNTCYRQHNSVALTKVHEFLDLTMISFWGACFFLTSVSHFGWLSYSAP